MNNKSDCKERVDFLFDNMDAWRQHPKYQLERRVDLFFYLYLKEVLEEIVHPHINDVIIPEFPVRKGTIFKEFKDHLHKNMSCNIDYVAMSEDKNNVYYIELKTDLKSINKNQNDYLEKTKEKTFKEVLEGIKEISKASKAKIKYYNLLTKLEELGAISNLVGLHDLIDNATDPKNTKPFPVTKYNTLVDKIIVNNYGEKRHIIIIQPEGEGNGIITFEDFRGIVGDYSDCISKRFAVSLEKWSNDGIDKSKNNRELF